MKILFLSLEYPPIVGGGSSFTKDICKYLARESDGLMLVTSGAQDLEEQIDGYTVKRFKTIHDYANSSLDINKALEDVASAVESFKPDVIHSVHQSGSLLTEIVNENYKIPLVITHHRTPQFDRNKIKKNGKELLFDFTNVQQDMTFIAPTKIYYKALLESIQRLSPSQIELIYPGVDNEYYNINAVSDLEKQKMRDLLQIKSEDTVLLLPMRLRGRKGLSFLSKTLSEYSEHSLKVVLTGYPENDAEAKIRAEFEAAVNVNHKVLNVQQFSNEDIRTLYQVCDFMILPSEGEGTDISYYEIDNIEGPMSTMMACADSTKTKKFIAVREGFIEPFDNTTPIAVYIPDGFDVQYHTMTAVEMKARHLDNLIPDDGTGTKSNNGDQTFECPASGYVDCMPGPDRTDSGQCSVEYKAWAMQNCKGFQVAY